MKNELTIDSNRQLENALGVGDFQDELERQVETNRRDRKLGIFFLSLVVLIGISDIFEDWMEGRTWSHVGVEASLIIVAIVGAVYLSVQSSRLRKANSQLYSQVTLVTEDFERWKSEAEPILRGLGEAIDLQFSRWELSMAEKEVGLLLLKGLSLKEIAGIRDTAEKTVRQQATSLYNKAKLDGRAQLSAFFLEDLLLPHK